MTDDDINRLRTVAQTARNTFEDSKLADLIDALLAERERLMDECSALAAGHCIHDDGLTADEGGTPYCAIKKERDALRAERYWMQAQLDRMETALAERHREVLIWEQRYMSLLAQHSSVMSLLPPPPIIIDVARKEQS